MDCNCERSLVETANIFETGINNIQYKILICENCKKYFIRRFHNLFEVALDDEKCWYITGKSIYINDDFHYKKMS